MAQVGDCWQDSSCSFGRDPGGKPQRQNGVAYHEIHCTLYLLAEDGHGIPGSADKLRFRATAEHADFVEQAFTPVGSNAERVDDNYGLASLLRKVAAFVARDSSSIGEQNHAIDGMGNVPAA